MKVPRGLDWWRGEPGGAAWLDSLPRLVGECAEEWGLRVGTPFEPAHISLVVPVRLRDDSEAVLKVNFPEPESEPEADALAVWDGRAAVRLFAYDAARRALLIERCRPGTQLWAVADDEEATRTAAGVLRRLWRPAPASSSFRRLADEARRWAELIPRDWEALGRPFERELLDAAVAGLRDLAATQGAPVVLHQDFHGGNVLRAEREPWLVIDPKPLVGEREFDAASLLRDRRWSLGPEEGGLIRRRLDVLSSELGLDRERMRGWGIGHALAWGLSADKLEPDMVECARLLAA